MKKLKYLTLLILFISSSLFAQLKEFEIKSEKSPETIPIFTNYPKGAAFIIYSSITNLSFSSNTGGITNQLGNPNEGKYILILEPEKQFINVKSPGFKEARIKVEGVSPKDVRYFSVEEKAVDMNKEKGTLILATIPDGVKFKVDGFPITGITPQTIEMVAMNYKFMLNKTGYKNKEVNIIIQPGKTVSKTIELEMDLDLISAVNYISTIKVKGEFIKDARVDIEGDNLGIYYNLNGDPSEKYEVKLLLKENNSDFELEPNLITGDYGGGLLSGSGKKIVWQSSKEYPDGFDINEYYLEISAEEISGSTWGYWVGGAAAVVGGAVAYLLLQGEETTTTTTSIPTPPDRP